MIKNERPQMRVNWVRVYQNPDDPVQKVGCSTPERPTRQWIAAHESLYKTEKDVSNDFCIWTNCLLLWLVSLTFVTDAIYRYIH